VLEAVGLPGAEIRRWVEAGMAAPAAQAGEPATLAAASQAASRYFGLGQDLLDRLPDRPNRDRREQEASQAIQGSLRSTRTGFLRAYAEPMYAELTNDYQHALRVDELVYRAAERFPGLTPTRGTVELHRQRLLKDQEEVEIDQGLFLSHLLAHPRSGAHLCWSMLHPLPESLERLATFQRSGLADLGAALTRRRGRAGQVEMRNPRVLNAEDDQTIESLEIAIDLVTLDPAIELGVLRGGSVDHPRYAGRSPFSAGINLTRLYNGKIPFLWYIKRELGLVNKLYRGLAGSDFRPDEPETTEEKLWIAAVDSFAIGGGCQLLLVMDYVLATEDSFFSLPARKEGIIPGAANLRLPRLVGSRLARQGILFDRRFPADSPEGRLLCDELVPVGELDAAIDRTVARLTASGAVSAAGNRRALRVGQEPLAVFQAYMATYAREQAYCHFSPALTANLETFWAAHQRRL
jgi:thioesterase DpgC